MGLKKTSQFDEQPEMKHLLVSEPVHQVLGLFDDFGLIDVGEAPVAQLAVAGVATAVVV